jgi:hypothetical protein
MALRAAMADAPPGPGRERALRDYCARVGAGARLTHAVEDRAEAGRRARAALEAEAGMLAGEPLSEEERRRATAAVRGALAACYGAAASEEAG